ncbi:hypothetical protein NC653_034323 [Populus alba x Populus x berolinensis]|uniref:Uncharacterized protein n=1 Tax=Populus alba x Populus x berolinensis TaxID=444605 RepID=A0AAD6PW39_9ROSI|nr:hypothetical protein NC653_034323 [Populus alba x Populus x berolinensis]
MVRFYICCVIVHCHPSTNSRAVRSQQHKPKSFGLCFMCPIRDSKCLTLTHSFGHLFVMYMTIEIPYYQYHGYSFHSKDFFRIVCAINKIPLHTSAKKEDCGGAT